MADDESEGGGDDLGFAVIDSGRALRTGYPEVVYCAGKLADQAEAIIARMREKGIPVLGTRASPELAERVRGRFPAAEYDEIARTITIGGSRKSGTGFIAVAAAGTSDLPAAREALVTARFYGSKAELYCDVGVAGIHRLFKRLPEIRKA
ncbi:MAG: 1-(5-phosphoribosyl)-5-amino-4-imidazole-carboxylate carboxylase, partial [Treponema sp.]|nr:1-(5-phosphoribosyl)-5-amino-4-imidazole-carboxylate carboxylase [Treponema sp.]